MMQKDKKINKAKYLLTSISYSYQERKESYCKKSHDLFVGNCRVSTLVARWSYNLFDIDLYLYNPGAGEVDK